MSDAIASTGRLAQGVAEIAVGRNICELPTPVLCLDRTQLLQNLRRVTEGISASGKSWRSAAGVHNSLEIARLCNRSGAVGMSCERVAQCAAFAAAGGTSTLNTDYPVGERRLQNLAEAAINPASLAVCEHYVQAQQLSQECSRRGVFCRTLIAVNLGESRGGIRPGHDTLELARGITRLKGLRLAGTIGFVNGQLDRTHANSNTKILGQMREFFRRNHLCCDTIAVSGYASCLSTVTDSIVTDIEVGPELFGCLGTLPQPEQPWLELGPALSVLATVVGRPAFDRAVIDAGTNSMSIEVGQCPVNGLPDAQVTYCGGEQSLLELKAASRELRIGDRVVLRVNDVARTIRCHPYYLVLEQDRVVAAWPIEPGHHVV